MKTPITPQGLPPQTAEDYLRGRYGAYRGHFAWRELEEAFNGGLRAQAASVEPVGKIINSGGNTGSLPEHPLLVWLGGVPPVGTELYASAPPSPANVPGAVEPLTKDDIDKLAEVLEVTSLDEVEPETVYAFTRAIEARFAPQPQAVVASSPAQAVDAVGESCAIFDSRGYYDWYDTEAQAKAWCDRYNARNVDDPLRPYTYVRLDALRAALQASRQPQAQQGGVESEEAQNYRWLRAHGAANSKQGSTAFDGDALRLGFQFMYWCDPGKLDQLITQKRAALAAKEPK